MPQNVPPPDLAFHLKHIVDDRAKAVAERAAWDERVKSLTKQIFTAMFEADCKRTQLMDGTTVSIVEPAPRKTIVPEKLLSLGVDPDTIRAATRESVVDPYVRVDAPKSPEFKDAAPEDHAAAERAAKRPPQEPDLENPTRH